MLSRASDPYEPSIMAAQSGSSRTISSAPIFAPSEARGVAKSTSTQLRATRTDLSVHFSQSQIALALSIQKSKPGGVSSSDYCEQLRKSIKTGHASKAPRYVDSVDFWKDQYSTIYLEKKALQDKVHRLEEEQRFHRQSSDQDGTQDGEPSLVQQLLAQSYSMRAGNPRKRHAPDDVEWWLEDQENQEAGLPSSLDDSTLRLSSYVLRIARKRIKFEKINKEFSLEHLEEATRQSIQILNILELAMSDCCLPLRQVKTNDEASHTIIIILQQLMHQIVISFGTCFEALDHICRTIPGRTKKPELVYGMVMFFNKSLHLLETVSNIQAEQEEEPDHRRLRNKVARTDEGEYAVNKHLVWALASIVSKIDWKVGKPGHSELLEGILFSILEHTGRLLSEAVFDEHVAKSTNPGNIIRGKASHNPANSKMEPRYIVQILHALFGTPEKKELIARVLASERKDLDPLRRLTSLAPSSSFTQDLVTKSKALIQSTLLKCTVGGDSLASLRLPVSLAEVVTTSVEVANCIEFGSREWLIENVWALIGWDMVLEKD